MKIAEHKGLQGHTYNTSNIWRLKNIRTACSSKSFGADKKEQEKIERFACMILENDARKEIEKFARQDAAVEKFRKNYYRARAKLASKIKRNQSLMELRHELQRKRCEKEASGVQTYSAEESGASVKDEQCDFNKVRLRY
ncbi:MAG: hypothetical protein WC454_07635 [Phycisphaerae bacterium]|jgi:hypothetical protein